MRRCEERSHGGNGSHEEKVLVAWYCLLENEKRVHKYLFFGGTRRRTSLRILSFNYYIHLISSILSFIPQTLLTSFLL